MEIRLTENGEEILIQAVVWNLVYSSLSLESVLNLFVKFI